MLKVATKTCLNDIRYLVHAATNKYNCLGTVPRFLGTVPSGAGGNYLHNSDTPTTVSYSKINDTQIQKQWIAVVYLYKL